MMRWMQQYLSSDFYHRSQQADRMQTLIYRAQLKKSSGWTLPGKTDALGLGWVYMAPKDGRSRHYPENRAAAVLLPIWR
ncbi:hypothetical protein KCP74_24780 [Salmonella enterica subsp. enterica]|nr:hypothetical protein KCP74_24780 [Salmonella enterica subsp. enterica]